MSDLPSLNPKGDTPQAVARTVNAILREEGLPHRWNAVSLPWQSTVPLTASLGALTGNLAVANFDAVVQQETHFSLRLPNTYAEGSNLHPVILWTPTDAGVGQVVWGLEYALGVPGAAVTSSTAILTTGVAGGALVYSRAAFPVISGSGLPIGTILFGRIYRDASATADTYASNANFLGVDIDVETDARGARAQSDKWAGGGTP